METLTQLLVDWGYWGLFLSALVAGSILPFSSEAVFVLLLGLGLDPLVCLAVATLGNTLGGMTCYAIGMLGRTQWFERVGVTQQQLARAQKFVAGRGAAMAFFAFLPIIGGAIAVLLGMMRSNLPITVAAMFTGKVVRYAVVLLSFQGIVSLF